jgi:hypothetical protein
MFRSINRVLAADKMMFEALICSSKSRRSKTRRFSNSQLAWLHHAPWIKGLTALREAGVRQFKGLTGQP